MNHKSVDSYLSTLHLNHWFSLNINLSAINKPSRASGRANAVKVTSSSCNCISLLPPADTVNSSTEIKQQLKTSLKLHLEDLSVYIHDASTQ